MFKKILFYISILMILILFGFFVDIYLTFSQLSEHNNFIAYSYLSFYVILIGFIMTYIMNTIVEFKRFTILEEEIVKKFKNFNELVDISERKDILKQVSTLLSNSSNDNIKSEAKKISEQIDSTDDTTNLKNNLEKLMKEIDNEAKQLIKKEAVSVALLTGISQKSSLDMIVVLYKNIRLIRLLLSIYGYRPNSYNTIVLLRKVLENVFSAAATEEVTSAITEGIAVAVGSFVGGVTNGLLVIRIGNSSIEFLSLTSSERVTSKEALGELIGRIKNKIPSITDKIKIYGVKND